MSGVTPFMAWNSLLLKTAYWQVAQILQKFRSHLKIMGTRKVTWSKCHTESPQILGPTEQNLLHPSYQITAHCVHEVCVCHVHYSTYDLRTQHVARMREGRGVHRVLVGKPEGKRPLGIHIRRWEDNIKMDLQEVGGCCGDLMELAQDRERWRTLVGTVMNFRFP